MAKSLPIPKTVPRITEQWVRNIANLIPRPPWRSTSEYAHQIGVAVIRRVLGAEWVEENIFRPKQGFLNYDLSTSLTRETKFMRIMLLGEMMLNLQGFEGYDACISQIFDPDQIESVYAELEIARLLYAHSPAKFRFRDSTGRKRGDGYDLDITYPDGTEACGETKCKQEETVITLATVEDSLEAANKQLPKYRPGIAFIKIPRAWLDDVYFTMALDGLAEKYMRATSQRIVSIKLYTASVTLKLRPDGGEEISEVIVYKERSSARHRFVELAEKNWDLFPNDPPATPKHPNRSTNGMPPWWKRLYPFEREQ